MGAAHGASDVVHLLPPHVYLQLLLGWGEHGLPGGAGCATVALSHIAATAVFLIGPADGGSVWVLRFPTGLSRAGAPVAPLVV